MHHTMVQTTQWPPLPQRNPLDPAFGKGLDACHTSEWLDLGESELRGEESQDGLPIHCGIAKVLPFPGIPVGEVVCVVSQVQAWPAQQLKERGGKGT